MHKKTLTITIDGLEPEDEVLYQGITDILGKAHYWSHVIKALGNVDIINLELNQRSSSSKPHDEHL